jgi:hypothetical protein
MKPYPVNRDNVFLIIGRRLTFFLPASWSSHRLGIQRRLWQRMKSTMISRLTYGAPSKNIRRSKEESRHVVFIKSRQGYHRNVRQQG